MVFKGFLRNWMMLLGVLESHSKRIIEQNEELLKSAERMNESNDLIVENTALIANYSKVNAYFSLANYLK